MNSISGLLPYPEFMTDLCETEKLLKNIIYDPKKTQRQQLRARFHLNCLWIQYRSPSDLSGYEVTYKALQRINKIIQNGKLINYDREEIKRFISQNKNDIIRKIENPNLHHTTNLIQDLVAEILDYNNAKRLECRKRSRDTWLKLTAGLQLVNLQTDFEEEQVDTEIIENDELPPVDPDAPDFLNIDDVD